MIKAELIEALKDWSDDTIIVIVDHEGWTCSIRRVHGLPKSDFLADNEFHLITANGRDELRDSNGNHDSTSHFAGMH